MNPPSAFVDAQCPRCGRRIGWFATDVTRPHRDRPPCPNCGRHPNPDDVAAAQAKCKHLHLARATSGGLVCTSCGLTFPGAHADDAGNLDTN